MPVIVDTIACPTLEDWPFAIFALVGFLSFFLIPTVFFACNARPYMLGGVRSISFTLRGTTGLSIVAFTSLGLIYGWVILCITDSWGHKIFVIADLVLIIGLASFNGADYIALDTALRNGKHKVVGFELSKDKWSIFQTIDAETNHVERRVHKVFAALLFLSFLVGSWVGFYTDFVNNDILDKDGMRYNVALILLVFVNTVFVALVASFWVYRDKEGTAPSWNTHSSELERAYIIIVLVFIAILPGSTSTA